MTSFAFILGVVPLVLATGAGASARKLDRHHGVHRHARLDLPRGAVRAVVLRGGAALRGMTARPRKNKPARKRRRRRNEPRRDKMVFDRQSQFGRREIYAIDWRHPQHTPLAHGTFHSGNDCVGIGRAGRARRRGRRAPRKPSVSRSCSTVCSAERPAAGGCRSGRTVPPRCRPANWSCASTGWKIRFGN